MRISEKDFDAVIDTNLKGTFHTMRLVARPMLRQRSGRIINISSVVGIFGNAGQANLMRHQKVWCYKVLRNQQQRNLHRAASP